MGFLILLFIIFIITVVIIVLTSPAAMRRDNFKADVKDLWGIVKICQMASYGRPKLELKPAKRSVLMKLHFLNADTLSITIPLMLKKQQKAKDSYMELFFKHDVKVVELENDLILHLDRKNEKLDELVAYFYKEIFEASDTDTVKFNVKTLKSDMRILSLYNLPGHKFSEDFTFEAPSSVQRVLTERILSAVYFLLYPLLIILSYKFWGLNGMCWAALVFFAFFAIYNPIYKKTSIAESMVSGSILYCILLSATLLTQKLEYLQSIPSVIGISTAFISLALALGIKKPWSKKKIVNKKNDPREFKFIQSFWVLGGVGLFLASEWARRNLGIDDWITFFGFVRIELMIVMTIIFAPAYVLFLKREGRLE